MCYRGLQLPHPSLGTLLYDLIISPCVEKSSRLWIKELKEQYDNLHQKVREKEEFHLILSKYFQNDTLAVLPGALIGFRKHKTKTNVLHETEKQL